VHQVLDFIDMKLSLVVPTQYLVEFLFDCCLCSECLCMIYRVIQNGCRGFNNLSYAIDFRQQYMYFFYLIKQHSKFLLHTLQVLYMCTLCDSADIDTIIEFVPDVSSDGFSGDSAILIRTFSSGIHTHPVS